MCGRRTSPILIKISCFMSFLERIEWLGLGRVRSSLEEARRRENLTRFFLGKTWSLSTDFLSNSDFISLSSLFDEVENKPEKEAEEEERDEDRSFAPLREGEEMRTKYNQEKTAIIALIFISNCKSTRYNRY